MMRYPGSKTRRSIVPFDRRVLVALGGSFCVVVGYTYLCLASHFLQPSPQPLLPSPGIQTEQRFVFTSSPDFEKWKGVAVSLAKLAPEQALEKLELEDPFGTRRFKERLADAEDNRNRRLTIPEIKELFPCPSSRISLPDRRDATKAQEFRAGKGFLFFQHLRKAGGTNFCKLAETNFPKENIPRYYCMPDYHWPQNPKGQACAGCLHHWTNHEITSFMGKHRIAGNEWDSFDVSQHFDLPALFVTSFRGPVNRALSQFRFECVENRGCKIKDVGEWWKKRKDLYNVYTWTFSDIKFMGRIADSTKPKDVAKRGEAISIAMDTVSRFHLVLAMEFLNYAEGPVQAVLGFQKTDLLHTPTRPHNQRQRQDSWNPKDKLTDAQWKEFRKYLALDEILTDAANRMFLERLVCGVDG